MSDRNGPGHPIHPAVVHFPVACWTLATIGDVSSIWLGERAWWVSGLLLAVGTVSAVAAMIAGVIELNKIDEQSQAAGVADTHMHLAFVTWTLYAISLFLRLDKFNLAAPGFIEISLSGLGLIALFVTGWLGGKLVYEHGVGVRNLH